MKQGVDYFPLDTVLDTKFELVEAAFGIKGFGVVVKLLQKIYAEQGYYAKLDKDIISVLAHRYGVGANLMSDIVAKAVQVGIFDVNMYQRHKILTSEGIQRRYLQMTRKRAFSGIRNEYSLVQLAQNPENTDSQAKNGVQNEQRKVKESKKEKYKKKYGELKNVELADDEYEKLTTRFGKKKLESCIDTLSLYIASSGKHYKSHYATILAWLRKDSGTVQGAQSYSGVRRFN